jgi:hypothetical protein
MQTTLPTPEQVAARALGLSALLCRASMEDPSARDEAEKMHSLVLRWLYDVGAEKGLKAEELAIVAKSPGELTREEVAHACWCQEELSVLAWALERGPIPRANQRYNSRALAMRVGFLAADAPRRLRSAKLREPSQLLQYSVIIDEVYRTLLEEWHREKTEDLAMGVCVAASRREAASWLVGEKTLELVGEMAAARADA